MNEIPLTEAVIRILIAIAIGAVIGAEREYREKAAGLRTIMLVSLGAALFSIYAASPDRRWENPQLAAGIVTGVGFLGAGVILHQRGHVIGLTTAASVWVAAALGMGAGLGLYALCALSTGLVLLILWLLPRLDWVGKLRDSRTYEITTPYDMERYQALCQRFSAAHLKITKHYLAKRGSDMVGTWHTYGKTDDHRRLMHQLLNDPDVKIVDVS